MRFDLDKFERDNPELAVTIHQNPRFFVRAAITAAEAALLAPSPCPNGCRMCDWVECEICQRGELSHQKVNGVCTGGHCTRCAELERVRKAAEDACCTVIDADHLATPPSVGQFLSFEHAFSAGICFAANHLSKTVESTGALKFNRYPPPRIDGDVLTYAGFQWQKLAVPSVEGQVPQPFNVREWVRRWIHEQGLGMDQNYTDSKVYSLGDIEECGAALERLLESRVSERTKELRDSLEWALIHIERCNWDERQQMAYSNARAILKKSDPTARKEGE